MTTRHLQTTARTGPSNHAAITHTHYACAMGNYDHATIAGLGAMRVAFLYGAPRSGTIL